jgi:hypothetical protein
MKIKIKISREKVDWLEGKLIKLTGYEAAYWVEILSEDGGKEWCRSSELHDFTYDANLKNQRYLYTNGDGPIPVTLSGYVYKNQRGQVYYSAGMATDEQCMNLLPANHLIKIIKRTEQTEIVPCGI